MEPQTKTKLYKYYFLATGLFLLISFAAAVIQNADPLNGDYYAGGGMYYLQLEYTKSNVKLIERSGCGNCDQTRPILLSGKPERKGDKILLHNRRYPEQVVAELTLQTDGSITYQHTDYAGEQKNLVFQRDSEGFSVNRILRKLGFPSSLVP